MADFKYEIVEHIGVISESAKGWTKELNKISWNGGTPKYDIREWAPEHEKMGKGMTDIAGYPNFLKELKTAIEEVLSINIVFYQNKENCAHLKINR